MTTANDNSDCPSGEYNEETLRFFREGYECTEEDMNYQFTDDQLKEICLRHKCRVMASRWNIAFEYGLWLRKEGRFVGKTPHYERCMITKGVNRHKSRLLYKEEDIQKSLEEEWRFRRKDSILSLRMWERERRLQRENEEDVHSEPSTSTMNGRREESEHELTANSDDESFSDDLIMGIDSDTMNSIVSYVDDSESQALPGEEENHLPTAVGGDDIAVVLSEPKYVTNTEFLDEFNIDVESNVDHIEIVSTGSQEKDEEVCAMFDFNTESLTQSNTPSFTQTETEDILSDDFNKEIPCTSTQNESEESVDSEKK